MIVRRVEYKLTGHLAFRIDNESERYRVDRLAEALLRTAIGDIQSPELVSKSMILTLYQAAGDAPIEDDGGPA